MIVYITNLKEIPKTCIDFDFACNIPASLRDPAKILKPYLKKRHPSCPLRVVKDECIKEVESCK